MSTDSTIALVISVALAVYLVVAMLYPEKFR